MKKAKKSLSQLEGLWKKAVEARKKSYSPYSKHKIGAALRMSDGQVFTGANVENASFGGTVCAERTAIWKAITEGAKGPISEIVVVSDHADPWPPCGLCRQVIAEFGTPETKIWVANTKALSKVFNFKDIFPEAFTPQHLKKSRK